MIGNLNEFNNFNYDRNNLRTQDANKIAYNPSIQNQVENKTAAGVQKKDVEKVNDCQTCANRSYQDGSNDAGVSFKTPTKLTPQQASSAVVSHEKEHYGREAARAESENKDVLVNSIRIHSSICPECGKSYVSGGETTTVTRTRKNDSPSPVKDVNGVGQRLDISL